MPKWFSRKELNVLDGLTANNKAVLASLGGKPDMEGMGEEEDDHDRREEGVEGRQDEQDDDNVLRMMRSRSRSAMRQRAGSIHR